MKISRGEAYLYVVLTITTLTTLTKSESGSMQFRFAGDITSPTDL